MLPSPGSRSLNRILSDIASGLHLLVTEEALTLLQEQEPQPPMHLWGAL